MFADFRKIFAAATGRRRLLAAALAAPLAAAGFHLLTAPARYTAVLPVTFRAADQAPDAPLPRYDKELRRLTSRDVLRRLADAERAAAVAATEKPAGLLSALLGASRAPVAAEALVDGLASAISLKPTARPGSFDIEFHADAPDAANRLARALASVFEETGTREAARAAEAESKRQDRRLTDLQNDMDEAARRLSAFRDANPTAAQGDFSAPLAAGAPGSALQEAKARRAAAEARLARAEAALRAGVKGGAPENLPDSPTIEKLRAAYAAQAREAETGTANLLPRHPDYLAAQARVAAAKGRLLTEVRRVAQLAQRDLGAARAAERRTEKEAASALSASGLVPAPRAEFAKLSEEASRAREAYEEALLLRPAPVAQAQVPQVEAVFGAAKVRRDSTSPPPGALLAAAAALGFLVWFGESARRDFAATLPAPGEKPAAGFALPRFAGALRRRAGPRQRAREIIETPGEPYRAAVGRLYRVLTRRRSAAGPTPTILVTGRAPRAGASTLALALSFFAAGCGDRVLLVTAGPQAPTKRRDYAAGEIMLAPGRVADPRLADLREAGRYDLMIVDGGAETPALPVDATLIVDRDGETGERRAHVLREKNSAPAARLAQAA